jgi:hypothetical protein
MIRPLLNYQPMHHYRLPCCSWRAWRDLGEASGLYNTEKMQYDKYYGDNDQNVDPTAGLREAWTDVPAEKAEQPQDYQNYDDSP